MSAQEVWLCFTLESAATFGRGDGIPGLIDREVALDSHGCPYLHGRTLKGLLNESCADLLYALEAGGVDHAWGEAADALFGLPGSTYAGVGKMHVGHARLPGPLRDAIAEEVTLGRWARADVTHALTGVRRQTAIDANGAPDPHTLRSMRVILAGAGFEALLTFDTPLTPPEQALLAATVKGFRRAGTARNRGRGRLRAHLEDVERADVTEGWYALLRDEVHS